ncbi:hypothetical protein [Sphingopyxis terrae]|uniref:hypothetical protein n=1 Tax=Sphingopyxis terrae TaxID=33052 RepID=UPI001055F58B|nr:hypothetical protein [Sphingopyxis terrae]
MRSARRLSAIDRCKPFGVSHQSAATLPIFSGVGSASSFNRAMRERHMPVIRVIAIRGHPRFSCTAQRRADHDGTD